MKTPANIILNICKSDKFVRDLWIRILKRNSIPDKEKIQYVLECFSEYYHLYPDLSIIEVGDIYEDSLMLHHKLYEFYDHEPLTIEADVVIVEEVLGMCYVSLFELVGLAKGYHLRGNISNFVQAKVNPPV